MMPPPVHCSIYSPKEAHFAFGSTRCKLNRKIKKSSKSEIAESALMTDAGYRSKPRPHEISIGGRSHDTIIAVDVGTSASLIAATSCAGSRSLKIPARRKTHPRPALMQRNAAGRLSLINAVHFSRTPPVYYLVAPDRLAIAAPSPDTTAGPSPSASRRRRLQSIGTNPYGAQCRGNSHLSDRCTSPARRALRG